MPKVFISYRPSDAREEARFVLEAVQVLRAEAETLAAESRRRIGKSGRMFPVNARPYGGLKSVADRAEAMSGVSLVSQPAQTAIKFVLLIVWMVAIAFKALNAARGYVTLGRDRIFAAVALGAAPVVIVSISLRTANTALELRDQIGPSLYHPLLSGFQFSVLGLGIMLPLRRRLRLTALHIALVAACLFVAAMAANHAIFWHRVPTESAVTLANAWPFPEEWGVICRGRIRT